MRILIVEDEPKTAAYVKKGLMEHGYVVDVASDGLDGLLAPAGEAAGFFDGRGGNVHTARHNAPAHEAYAARTTK